MRKIISFVCIIALLLGNVISVSAAQLKDTVPPVVLSSTPSAGQINVSIDNTAIVVKFKEPVAKGFNFAKITLLNSQRKVIPLTLFIKGDILTAVANNKLSWSSAYTLTIPNGAVKDLAGNNLAKPYSISFRTVPQPIPLSEELKQVVVGISKLSVPNPGALEFANNQWLPVAGAESDMNSVFLAARKYGNGRILAIGKEDLLSNDSIYTLDNLQFIKNALKWLNGIGVKRVGYSVGHDEFINIDSLASLSKELSKDKFTFSATKLTTTDLKSKDILIIGNPWKSLSKEEISAVEGFVSNGGSLILAGLGWSYHDYHPGSPYPMNVLSAGFGVRWSDTAITDTPEKYKDAPVFNVFFPYVNSQDKILQDAMNYIRKITYDHPKDLPTLLQNDIIEYNRLVSSLAAITEGTSLDSSFGQKKYDFLKAMITNYPQYYSKEPVSDSSLYPNMAWLREHFIKAWIDVMPLTTVTKAEIADTVKIKDTYKKIWDDFGIYIADNNGLSSAQTAQIYKMLSLIPTNMHSITIISAAECLGSKPINIKDFVGESDAINIFKLSVGEVKENSFPSDISEGIGDIFTLVLAHEINHVVDAKTINADASLVKRKSELLSNAGRIPDNYLRSMFESGFFTNAPQEFFASMSNQWFTNSAKTVKLGLTRLDNGFTQPINQALFFAEVYSQGGNNTYFYSSDAIGNIARTTVPLIRDEKGRIKSITFDGYRYDFTLNNNGDVINCSSTKI